MAIRNLTHVSTILATRLLSEQHDSNVVFSPLSMQAGLSLAAAGSKGETLDQLLAFLKTNTIDELNSLYSQLVSETLVDGTPNGGPRLSFVNGVWLDKTLSLKPSFKEVVKSVHKASCKRVDFKTKCSCSYKLFSPFSDPQDRPPLEINNQNATKIPKKVNLWAKKKTNGLIKKVLPDTSVNDLIRLIFANAVYFKGAWSQKFHQSMTKEYDFHLLDGKKVKAPMMTSGKDQLVSEYDDFKVLGLPYSKGQDKRKFTMYVFLPDAKDGLQSLVQKIGSISDFIEDHIPWRKVEVGRLLVPKFKISFWFEASSMLKELGLILPFSDGCDFTDMTDSTVGENLESLKVSSIYHKTYVEVCEEGTKAASVNVMPMRLIMSPAPRKKPRKVDFVADHPFLFVIREDVSGVVLFMERVNDPRVD